MFNRYLNFGMRRRAATRPYGKVGGGAALPLLALLGWKYREPIKQFFRDRFGSSSKGAATETLPGTGALR